jgi:hypothetical protein
MTKLLVSCALAALTFAVAPQALKAAEALCPLQNATLRGTYLSHGTGTIVNVGPIAAAGTATYDGNGNTSNTFTASVNGTIEKGVTVTGTYTVNPDCIGSLAASGAHYDFVVAPDGNTVFWIATDTGLVFSGSQVRMRSDERQVTDQVGSSNTDREEAPSGGATTENAKSKVRLQHLQAGIGPSKAPKQCWNPSV